jgi:hypothetical protein
MGPHFKKWLAKLDEPFFGVTVNGNKRQGLFELADEDAPVEKMVCLDTVTSICPLAN